MEGNKYGLFTDAFTRDPHPVYKRMRETAPMERVRFPDGQLGYLVTRYADAVAVLKDQRFVKDYAKLVGGTMDQMSVFTQNMLFADPPDHRRLRGLVQQAFTPAMISGMRGRIEGIAEDLLDELAGKREIELINDYAFPLSIIVICEILGVPTADRDKFRRWSNSLIEGTSGEPGVSVYQHMTEFVSYLNRWFEQIRQKPDGGLISKLIAAEEAGDKLTEKEIYGVVTLLIIAGHETTVNLIGNCVLSLLSHPDQYQLLKEQPVLTAQAIEETLRFNGPVEFSTSRWAGEDFEFNGTWLRKGELVIVSLNSANHDPDWFDNPENFQVAREKSPHLAFGTGIHHCLGAPLARLEGEIAISSLLKRFPAQHLNTEIASLQWRSGMIVRGIKQLPLLIG